MDFIKEIAVEVITSAEVDYRAACMRSYRWRVGRNAELEEAARPYQLELERQERERQRQLEQARVDRLLDEATSLRKAADIRAYVEAVKAIGAKQSNEDPGEAIENWARWALAQADRIDPVANGRYLRANEAENDLEADDPANYEG